MQKSQVSMELIMLLGFILLLSGPLIVIYYTYSNDTEFEISQNQALGIANKIVDNAESIYYLGDPSKVTLKVSIPENIYDIKVNLRDVTIVMYHNGKYVDVVAESKVNLTEGRIDKNSGIKYVTIESIGHYVNISFN